MNRINLLKTNSSKQHRVQKQALPVRTIIIVVGAVGIVAATLFSVRYVTGNSRIPKTTAVKDLTPSPFTPSTYTDRSSIVEEVVREVGNERAAGNKSGPIDIPYNELSFLEKVNYEVLFAKNVFSILNRAVPAGIGLRSLELDNFQTLYAVGLGNTRELVTSTFVALKTEKLELLPQPFSYITSNDGDGYRFVVTCKINSGLDLTDPFQASDRLPSRDDLSIITKKIISLGKTDSVYFSPPVQTDTERVGTYRRFHYRYRGTSTYNNFVKLLLSLHSNNVPCAFKKINLKARSGIQLAIDAHVLFTVKD